MDQPTRRLIEIAAGGAVCGASGLLAWAVRGRSAAGIRTVGVARAARSGARWR